MNTSVDNEPLSSPTPTKERIFGSRFRRHAVPLALLACLWSGGAPAEGVATVTLAFETEGLDLDMGTITATLTEDLTAPAGVDLRLAYHADRLPHAVVFPAGEGVEMAFVADVGFEGVSSLDVAGLVFSPAPSDVPFTPADCVVIRTNQGAVFKLGNPTENGTSVTFQYQPL